MEKIILITFLLDAFFACWHFKKLNNKLYFLPALIAAGTAAYGLYQSYQQKKKANQLKDSKYVPPAVEEAVANSRRHATASSPMYTRGKESLRQSTASTINNARRIGGSSVQVQQAVADADAREKEAIKDLEVSDQAFKNTNREELNQQLAIKGRFQQASRDAFNATKSALVGASKQNQYNAITTLGEGVIASAPDKWINPDLASKKDPITGAKIAAPKGMAGVTDFSNMSDDELAAFYQRLRLSSVQQRPGSRFATGYRENRGY